MDKRWAVTAPPRKKPEVQAPFSTIGNYNNYTFYNVHALFAILDDLEAQRDRYYEALCVARTGRYFIKPAKPIDQLNTGETAIDLLRWYAYLEDWPFYIERLRTQFYKNKGVGGNKGGGSRGKGVRGVRVINKITLAMRPLSWFGVEISRPARCLHRAMNNARAEYKKLKLHEGSLSGRLHSVRIGFNAGSYTWQDKTNTPMQIVSMDLNIEGSTACQSFVTVISSAAKTDLLPSTTT